MHSNNVAGSRALLVIDAQDSFKVGTRWARRSNPDFERNVGNLIEAFRAADLPVIYFLHSDRDRGFAKTDPEYRLMSFISPRETEPVFEKTTRNCFTSTALQPYLLSRGIQGICVCGIQMEQCCETTARVGADLGFEVDFVTDATMTFPISDPGNPGKELGVEAIRERTEYVLRGRFARILRIDQALEEYAAAGSLA